MVQLWFRLLQCDGGVRWCHYSWIIRGSELVDGSFSVGSELCGVIIYGSVVIQRWYMVGSDLVQLGVVRCALGQPWVR